MQLHSVYVMRDEWTPYEFKNYLKRHMLTPIKLNVSNELETLGIHGDQYRARIRPPAYKSYITKVLHTQGFRIENFGYNRPSMNAEDRKVYMVMGIGEPNEKYNRHLHDFSYQNVEIK